MKLKTMLGLVGILNACADPRLNDTQETVDTWDTWDSEDWAEILWPETTCEELLDGKEADSKDLIESENELFQNKMNVMYYHLERFRNGEIIEDAIFRNADGENSGQMHYCSTCSIYLNHVTPVFVKEENGIKYGLEIYLDEAWLYGSYENWAEGHEAVLTPSEDSTVDYVVGEAKKVFEFSNFRYEEQNEAFVEVADPLFEAGIMPEEGPNYTLGNSNGYTKLKYDDGSRLEGCITDPQTPIQTLIFRFYSVDGADFGEYL